MKKFVILILASISLNSYSQAPRGYYLKAGFSQTSLETNDLESTPGAGFMAGINFNFGYHETYNYQFEALYNQSVLKLESVDNTNSNRKESKYKYSNIEFGFYGNYYIIKPDEGKFFLGPQAGIFVAIVDPIQPSKGAAVNGEYYLPYLLTESDFEDTSQFNSGIGLGLTGGYNDLRFDLRYSFGFANMLKNVQTQSYDESHRYIGPTLEAKTKSISLGISYNIF